MKTYRFQVTQVANYTIEVDCAGSEVAARDIAAEAFAALSPIEREAHFEDVESTELHCLGIVREDPPVFWTQDDQEAAMRQGWLVAQEEDGTNCVQYYQDGPSPFVDDASARLHVVSASFSGDELAQRAVRHLIQANRSRS